mgnify:CR=1 FL=1
MFIINNSLKARYIVFASGSISQEKTNGYELIKSFGHKVSELSPGLVNLITEESTQSLRGLRIKCKTVINNKDYLILLEAKLLSDLSSPNQCKKYLLQMLLRRGQWSRRLNRDR